MNLVKEPVKFSPWWRMLFSRRFLWLFFFCHLFYHNGSPSMDVKQLLAGMCQYVLDKKVRFSEIRLLFFMKWMMLLVKKAVSLERVPAYFYVHIFLSTSFISSCCWFCFSFSGNTSPFLSCAELSLQVFQCCSQLSLFILTVPYIFLLPDNFK